MDSLSRSAINEQAVNNHGNTFLPQTLARAVFRTTTICPLTVFGLVLLPRKEEREIKNKVNESIKERNKNGKNRTRKQN